LSKITPYIDDTMVLSKLREIYPNGKISIFGVKKDNNYFKKMVPDDIVCIYNNPNEIWVASVTLTF